MRSSTSSRKARAPQFAAQGSRAKVDGRVVLCVRSPHRFLCKQKIGAQCGAWKSQSKQRGGRAKNAPGGSCALPKCAQLRIGKQSRAPFERAAHSKSCISLATQRERARRRGARRAEQGLQPLARSKSSQGALGTCVSLCCALRRMHERLNIYAAQTTDQTAHGNIEKGKSSPSATSPHRGFKVKRKTKRVVCVAALL